MSVTQQENPLKNRPVLTFDGIIIGDSGREAPSLDQGILTDPNNNQIDSVGHHELSEDPFTGKSLEEIFTETEPYEPCWRIATTIMNKEVHATMVYQSEEFVPKRKNKEVKRRSSGKPSIENQLRSQRKQKKTVTEKCLMFKPDKLITLTTRQALDRQTICACLTRLLRKIRSLEKSKGKTFQYLAVPEIHDSEKTSDEKRGSYHVHMATKGFIHYNKLRQMWRESVKEETAVDDPAMLDSSTSKSIARRNTNRRPAAIAKYMSKYIGKSFGDEIALNKKRYWSSKSIPKPIKIVRYARTGPGIQLQVIKYVESLTGKKVINQFDSSQVDDPDTPPFLWLATY